MRGTINVDMRRIHSAAVRRIVLQVIDDHTIAWNNYRGCRLVLRGAIAFWLALCLITSWNTLNIWGMALLLILRIAVWMYWMLCDTKTRGIIKEIKELHYETPEPARAASSRRV